MRFQSVGAVALVDDNAEAIDHPGDHAAFGDHGGNSDPEHAANRRRHAQAHARANRLATPRNLG